MNSLGIIVFDMDGTLVDSMQLHARVFGHLLNEFFNVPCEFGIEFYLSTAGHPLDRQFVDALKTQGVIVSSVEMMIDAFWRRIEAADVSLFPDVAPAIVELRRAGYILAVTSGCTPMVVSARLSKARIGECFAVTLGTVYSNPDFAKGEGHLRILKKSLGVSEFEIRTNSAIVGDAVFDVRLAKAAKMLAIGRITADNQNVLREAGADILINGLDQLVSLLRKSREFIPISVLKESVQ